MACNRSTQIDHRAMEDRFEAIRIELVLCLSEDYKSARKTLWLRC